MANMQYIADNLVESGTILNGLVHISNDDQGDAALSCCVTSDGYIVIANWTNGVDTYSISDGVLTHVDNDTTSSSAFGCCVTADGYIVIADGLNGVDTYSQVAGVLTHVDNDNTSIESYGCCVTADGYIVIADGANGVDTYSQVAGVLTHVDNDNTSTSAYGCCITADGYIVIADRLNGVDTYSQVAGVLTHVDNDDQGGSAQSCCVTTDGYIVIANFSSGVQTYSHVAGVLTPVDSDSQGGDSLGCCVTADGYIGIANSINGVEMYSHVAGVLTWITNDNQPGESNNCCVTSDGYIIAADGTNGVDTYRFDYIEATAIYPITNLYNRRPGKPLITTLTTYNIVVDFAVAKAISGVALMGHNIDSGATITIEGNAANTWVAPSKSESITWAETNLYDIFTSGSYRFWRLVITGAATSIKIGEYILGVATTLTNNYQWGAEKAKRYKNITQTTEYGQPWSNYLFNQRSYSLTFAVNDTTVTELETLHEDVQGSNKPFTFINWDEEAVYVRMEDELNFKRTYLEYNESKIELLELPLGKDI